MADQGRFTFFYQGTFSNFYASPFVDPAFYPSLVHADKYRQGDGIRFQNVEQYMHACKALVCGDMEVFNKIMEESDPKAHKRLGRQVTPYDDELWKEVAREVVTRGCWLKFGQNEDIWRELNRTGESLLVECAPRDTRWGIGLGVGNPKCADPNKWRGTNWLGQCLTGAREHVRKGTEPGLPELQEMES
eukprot:TRINITY_DN14792_c0_g1_i1.p1 TRINITY_DN14792_c0_g1~~TRINITY_DN14792_c0_g1_i1.p1  ORF type:complete len:198 (-),score=41.60 TRINITY_DN14792_c0_g1_i1:100-666(-)